jgi:hypothetical protein
MSAEPTMPDAPDGPAVASPGDAAPPMALATHRWPLSAAVGREAGAAGVPTLIGSHE